MTKRSVISILVADRTGVLLRIAEVFGARNYNVDSICSGSCEEPNCQRITIVCKETATNVNKIIKLLADLIDVYNVKLVNPQLEIAREMMLAKIAIEPETRQEILSLLNLLKVEIIDLNDVSVTFEVASSAAEIDNICKSLAVYNIIELSRTGEAAIHG